MTLEIRLNKLVVYVISLGVRRNKPRSSHSYTKKERKMGSLIYHIFNIFCVYINTIANLLYVF